MSFPSLISWTILILAAPLLLGQEVAEKPITFVRPSGKDFVKECTIALSRDQVGWNITSDTYRGDIRLTIISRYDTKDRLTGATVTLAKGDDKKSAAVRMEQGKAKVTRAGKPALEFEAPAGVIVTSAPDWTDIWLLCRRYDRKRGGKQTFAGLWIHPEQDAQAIPFHIERVGRDAIDFDGRKIDLDRFAIQIRGGSRYVAWADEKGGLVKLAPLPVTTGGGIMREDVAASVKELGIGLK